MTMVEIANRPIGDGYPCYVIAEAGVNHNGSLELAKRLVDIAETMAGPITGGLGAATVLACLFFGAISGSGPATTAAVGMLMIPAMTKRHYEKSYASAVTASAGGLGIIIPPSIPMVIFGISALGLAPPAEAIAKFGEFASLSIPKLFIAGVVPGLVMATALLTMNYMISRRKLLLLFLLIYQTRISSLS